MLILVLGSSIIIYLITITFSIFQLRSNAMDETTELMLSSAREKANEIHIIMEEDLAVARTFTMTFETLYKNYSGNKIPFEIDFREKILRSNPRYATVWSHTKVSYTSPSTSDMETESIVAFLDSGKVKYRHKFFPDSFFEFKEDDSSLKEEISEPYYYIIKESDGEQLVISPSCAIYKDGHRVGDLGLDILLDERFNSITNIDFSEKGHAVILTHTGKIVSHVDQRLINESVEKLGFDSEVTEMIIEKVAKGETFVIENSIDPVLGDVLVVFVPIPIGTPSTPWAVGVEVPLSEITRDVDVITAWSTLVALIGLLGLSFIVYKIANSISVSVKQSSDLLKDFSEGKLDVTKKLEVRSENELGQLSKSINFLMDEMTRKSEFAQKIGRGDLDIEFYASGEQDVLGKSLLIMRDNLNSVIDEANRVITEAGVNGRLKSARMELKWGSGSWTNLAQSINVLLDSIAAPFQKVNEILEALSQGDLTGQFDGEAQGDVEEIASNLNRSLSNIEQLLREIGNNANVVDESSNEMMMVSEEMKRNSEEIAAAISQISIGAHNQVCKIDESSGLISNVLSLTEEMNDKATDIHDAATNGMENSKKGLEKVSQMDANLGTLVEFSTKTYQSIEELRNQSGQVESFTKIITEIAEQTNLLSLNASIEAAQAGENGRGFSVIATEIRKLADDTKKSSFEIQQLIRAMLDNVEKTTLEVANVHESIKSNAEFSTVTSKALTEIADASSKTLTISREIQQGLKKQLSDVKGIVGNIEQVVVVSEQSAAATEEIAASAGELNSGMNNFNERSEKLSNVSSELTKWVNKFTLKTTVHMEDGNK